MKFHVCPHSKGDAQSIITFFRTRLQTTILCWFEIPESLAILSCQDIGTEILILVSGVDGVSADTIHLLYQMRHWQSPPGNSSGCVCGYSPVFWHPVPVLSIVLQILIIHFGFYQPFHQGTSLQGLPLSSSCHIANAIHLIVLGDNIQSESYLDLADFTADHLQTQLMYDELAVDVSQFIKLVSAKEESPSFSFLLCISRFVSPQEFHIDFDFILLSAGLLLSGLPASITGEWQNFIEISDATPLSPIFTRNDPMSPVQHLFPLTCFSPHGCDTTEVAGTTECTPPPVPPASLLRLRQRRRHDVSVSGPAYSPPGSRSSLISRAKPRVRHRRFCDPRQHLMEDGSLGSWMKCSDGKNHQLRQRRWWIDLLCDPVYQTSNRHQIIDVISSSSVYKSPGLG